MTRTGTRSAVALFPLCFKAAFVRTARKKLNEEGSQTSDSALLKLVRKCCSRSADFITGQMPVLESIFRFFIASGNEPITVEELGRQLSERRGGDISRTSAEVLLRLLKNDRYYGFYPVTD